jgi:3-deoxy-7-phosphoheptulonate synthase/chorismate mutase
MKIQMKVGIGADHPHTQAVIKKARRYGLLAEISESTGRDFTEVEVRLIDTEQAKAGSLGEFMFSSMPGVAEVVRITPSAVSLETNGDYHVIEIGSVKIGRTHPCILIAGPCTVDRNTDQLIRIMAENGIKIVRGGCWKPRSRPGSYTGPGVEGVRILINAAKKYGLEGVCIEVMDTCHVKTVKTVLDQSGYKGTVVLWVGARTSNQELMLQLGQQNQFPVIVKNGLYETVDEFINRVGWLLVGEQHFNLDGQIIPEESIKQGNDQILLLVRGQVSNNRVSRYRFDPKLHLIGDLISRCWTPVGFDPSHAAGTMRDDLVLKLMEAALRLEDPDFIMLETKLDYADPVCDADQAVPASRIPEVLRMLDSHSLIAMQSNS